MEVTTQTVDYTAAISREVGFQDLGTSVHLVAELAELASAQSSTPTPTTPTPPTTPAS